MIGTIRKHSTWLWIIIIVATIVSFVYFFSPNTKMSDVRDTGDFGTIFGQKVTRYDFLHARNEVYLRYFFTSGGRWPDRDAEQMGFNVQRETYIRLLLIREQERYGIHVGNDTVAQVAANLLKQMNRGQPAPLDAFVEGILHPRGLTAEDFMRFVRHDLGMQELIMTAGATGKLVTPEEIRALYEREHQEMSVQAVFFSASNYMTGVTVTPEALAQFYTNQMANYRLPDRVRVSYVRFAASNYLAEATQQLGQITNLDEQLEAEYERLGTNYFSDTKSPAEAKERLRKEKLDELALSIAREKATEFARPLYDMNPVQVGNLEKLAKEKELAVQVSEPFDRDQPPPKLDVFADFAKAAFDLDDQDPVNGPLIGQSAAYVIELKDKIPSEVPPLADIHERVTGDYKFTHGLLLARQAGVEFYHTATNELAEGKTFSAVCSAAKVHPVFPPPFSLSTSRLPQVEDEVRLAQFKQATFSTTTGHVSSFVPSSLGGFLVFLQARLPIDEVQMKEQLPAFAERVRRSRQSEAFNQWLGGEIHRGAPQLLANSGQSDMSDMPPE